MAADLISKIFLQIYLVRDVSSSANCRREIMTNLNLQCLQKSEKKKYMSRKRVLLQLPSLEIVHQCFCKSSSEDVKKI